MWDGQVPALDSHGDEGAALPCLSHEGWGWEGVGQGAEGHTRWADLEKLPESILVKEEEEEGGRG